MRGNRHRDQESALPCRSIPACAGEPACQTRSAYRRAVYPRVCGGTSYGRAILRPLLGLSPRVRGNRWSDWSRPHHGRSIPACAGEPSPARPWPPRQSVYPRVCGGTYQPCLTTRAFHGLSPRVRGNRCLRRLIRSRPRSIPACAGEPVSFGRQALAYRVYPRVCGGTGSPHSLPTARWGLSPRVRGNRKEYPQNDIHPRSIPACAGEPERSTPE